MTERRQRILETTAQTHVSKAAVDSNHQEWAMAHNRYNAVMTETPGKGRRSGTDLEDLRLHCVAAYESLLDSMRIHHDNLAHLAALKGQLR